MTESEFVEHLTSDETRIIRNSLYDECSLGRLFFRSDGIHKQNYRIRGLTNDDSYWTNCWSDILMLAKEALDDTY